MQSIPEPVPEYQNTQGVYPRPDMMADAADHGGDDADGRDDAADFGWDDADFGGDDAANDQLDDDGQDEDNNSIKSVISKLYNLLGEGDANSLAVLSRNILSRATNERSNIGKVDNLVDLIFDATFSKKSIKSVRKCAKSLLKLLTNKCIEIDGRQADIMSNGFVAIGDYKVQYFILEILKIIRPDSSIRGVGVKHEMFFELSSYIPDLTYYFSGKSTLD
ncbi:AKAP8 [Acrasis kona]|uniref:AKAP8 n=1 Tax=Acrasis kona TaxID=1008807 RepID=A0AAW2YXC6_9EUKA